MEKGFIGNYVDAYFKQYLNFSGKATRSQFWLAILANIIVSGILGTIDWFCFLKSFAYDDPFFMMMPLSYIYSLLILIPSLALSVRRLHGCGGLGDLFLWSGPCVEPLHAECAKPVEPRGEHAGLARLEYVLAIVVEREHPDVVKLVGAFV